MKLDSVVFYSDDLEKVVDFYQNIIGLQLESQNEQYVSFKLENGVSLGIKKREDEREVPGHQTLIISTDNINILYKKFKKKNLEFYEELKDYFWGRHFSILDPDKNKVEFVQR